MKTGIQAYRRSISIAALAIGLIPAVAVAASLDMMTTGGCSCCHAWARQMRAAGFEVTVKDLTMGQLARAKHVVGIPAMLGACHTARIGGYVVEGHVPAREIQRLLAERPDAIGLVVPGMPIGSPGMESGKQRDSYEVLLLKIDGSTEVFARYASQP